MFCDALVILANGLKTAGLGGRGLPPPQTCLSVTCLMRY